VVQSFEKTIFLIATTLGETRLTVKPEERSETRDLSAKKFSIFYFSQQTAGQARGNKRLIQTVMPNLIRHL